MTAQLGDTVRFSGTDGFNDGVVSQVHTDGTVDVFRVYACTSDFSCAGENGASRVITYIGTETVGRMDPARLTVLRKADKIR